MRRDLLNARRAALLRSGHYAANHASTLLCAGTPPACMTFPSTTTPGVDMTPYPRIFVRSVTFSTVTSTPFALAMSSISLAVVMHLEQPEPSTLNSFIVFLLDRQQITRLG